ncbi:putative snf2 family helicase protein [Botrytis fragariae]|uniref:Putative snf2 family helicase protein n=1 Tax=Botrytis fragariae TaxID=1964551 RepID=A0A8H6EHQ3_9HELO|nr:putative snf2 family helicase protein [Botrytis fragariae]KAF5872687.1 putative snf2 family helicase protein [Botrytis fragariae]
MSLSEKQKALLKELNNITLDVDGILTSQTVEEASQFFLKDLRPGRGLIGNKSEEEKFGARKTPNAGLSTEPSSSHSAHSDGDEDDDAVSDIDNIEQGDRTYKPNRPPSPTESDEEEIEEEEEVEESDKFDDKYVVINGIRFGLWDYLGFGYMDYIKTLYNVEPIKQPADMTVVLHDYQRKIIAQSLLSLNSPFRGFLNGSAMGLGKTIEAIVTMYLFKNEPGMSFVVCPAALCPQWVKAINSSWKEGHGITAFHLHDSSLTAHDVQGMGCDVLVMSYNFVETNKRKSSKFAGDIALYANGSKATRPKRPTMSVQSEIWHDLKLQPKLLVLDEAQMVNKPALAWARALMALKAKRVLVMSGTLPHNQWTNVFGYLKFLKGHPFHTQSEFLRVFGTPGERITSARKLACLARFMQGFTIAHPSSILNLPQMNSFRISFNLLPREAVAVAEFVFEYKKCVIGTPDIIIDGGDRGQGLGLFTYAIQAQVKAGHPMMGEYLSERWVRLARLDGINFRVFSGEDVDDQKPEERKDWLERVKKRPDIVNESGRLSKLMELFRHLTITYPERKLVMFSSFLKFLDIVEEGILRRFKIQSLRYDGTTPSDERPKIEEAFVESNNNVPLLMTAGSGSIGLNITSASIVIICEPWWNRNLEKQAIARVYRQGQEKNVLLFKLFGLNSAIDAEVVTVAEAKVAINEDLMRVLVTKHDEQPKFDDILTHPPVPHVEFPETAVI